MGLVAAAVIVTPIDPLALAAVIAEILGRLGIRYVIGGSVASSIVGEPRSTRSRH